MGNEQARQEGGGHSPPYAIKPRVCVVGDWGHADFEGAVAWLREQGQCDFFKSAAQAVERLNAQGRNPAAILLMQSRPGEFKPAEIEALHAVAPLSRLVALVGVWCEGEARSGRPWPGVVRVSWRSWKSGLPAALGLSPAGNGAPPQPRTMTEVERIESAAVCLRRLHLRNATAAVFTSRRAMFESLADALGALRIKATWHDGQGQPRPAADLRMFDGWDQIAADSADESPRIVLLDFPRPEDIAQAHAVGIAAVLPQPLLIADLAAAIDGLWEANCNGAHAAALTGTPRRK